MASFITNTHYPPYAMSPHHVTIVLTLLTMSPPSTTASLYHTISSHLPQQYFSWLSKSLDMSLQYPSMSNTFCILPFTFNNDNFINYISIVYCLFGLLCLQECSCCHWKTLPISAVNLQTQTPKNQCNLSQCCQHHQSYLKFGYNTSNRPLSI